MNDETETTVILAAVFMHALISNESSFEAACRVAQENDQQSVDLIASKGLRFANTLISQAVALDKTE